MTQTAAVATATAALCPWWFLRLFLVAVFERWTRRVQGLEFEEQARVIEEFTYRC
ncbi:hypothetical protein O5699_00605 [Escherichia coli]|nr:hypothetical protein [Escherichia coli]